MLPKFIRVYSAEQIAQPCIPLYFAFVSGLDRSVEERRVRRTIELRTEAVLEWNC